MLVMHNDATTPSDLVSYPLSLLSGYQYCFLSFLRCSLAQVIAGTNLSSAGDTQSLMAGQAGVEEGKNRQHCPVLWTTNLFNSGGGEG